MALNILKGFIEIAWNGFVGPLGLKTLPDGGSTHVVVHVPFVTAERPVPQADFTGCMVSSADESTVLNNRDSEAATRTENNVIVERSTAAEPTLGKCDGSEVVFQLNRNT